MNTRPRARTSFSSAHPSLKGGENRCHLHSRTIQFSKVGELRKKAFDVERWLVVRKQVAPTASRRYGLLVHGDSGVIPVD
jgi:hypothetical protein